MPRLSVVIATHNRPRTLVRAIESARAASADTVELVVVDDASTDETARVCAEQAGVSCVMVARNQGVAGARNVGVLAATGDYLTFLDDDDERLPRSLDRQIDMLEAHPDAGLVYGQAIVRRASATRPEHVVPARCSSGDIFWSLLTQNFVPCGSVVFRRSCLLRVGMLDESIAGIDDWDLWVRITECHPVVGVSEPVMVWRQSSPVSGQGTSAAAHLATMATQRFRQSWLTLPRVAGASRATRRVVWSEFSMVMARHLLWDAVRATAAGRPDIAARDVAVALRLHPVSVVRVVGEVPSRWPRIRERLRDCS